MFGQKPRHQPPAHAAQPEKRRPTRRAHRQLQHLRERGLERFADPAGSRPPDADAKILADQLFLLPTESGRRWRRCAAW
ncbi:hypothetical protein M8494_09035 [Serratia ureilytica]